MLQIFKTSCCKLRECCCKLKHQKCARALYNQFFAHVSAGSNISCSFRALYLWSCAQVTAGSNVLGSFSAFCYTFCEKVTTGANVWRFLVYHIDFVQKLLRKQLLYFFSCIFSLILCNWLRELAFFLDHFISFNWNFVFL